MQSRSFAGHLQTGLYNAPIPNYPAVIRSAIHK
jgi:hypothetical protein